jgi:hypothetical protein
LPAKVLFAASDDDFCCGAVWSLLAGIEGHRRGILFTVRLPILNLNFISVIVGKKGASDERLWKHHVFNL